ncbi:uncharacterized protein LOC131041932 isoform X2 [Cryptomeria japonica]|uniref:uncharacterized protein LOC131041932 isoform X2 n=1 Tax=Cryptomeria japonica TaxID=3369 RepID=UPI0025AD1D30|nr:uncharacterized protein LOC131041932 isoform X2 [Cryptomeria japonica]
MSQSWLARRSAYLSALTQRIERKLQKALDSPTQRPDLLQELFTDVVLEVDSRAQAILFDENEDVINSAEDGMRRSPCFYEVLAEHYLQMPENGEPVLRLIVQLWSQSFASQIFSLLFYKWLFDLEPENLEVSLRYASAFAQGATNIFWIDVQSNTTRFFSLFHPIKVLLGKFIFLQYIFEEVALVPRRLNKIPIQARRKLFMPLSRFLFFYEPERLEILLNHFPSFPNAFLVGGPEDFFVIELTDQLQKLKVEPVLLNYLKCMRVLQAKEIRMTTSTRLKSCLYSFTSPGGPMYPTRAVRHAAWETLDLLFPVGRYPRHLISIFFRLLHPYYWPSSCWNFIVTCVKALLCALWMTLYKLYERVFGKQINLRNRK